MQVIALIGDIVDSKSIQHRAPFQRRLGQILAARTKEAAGLASPFTLTLGDEFQAVYRAGRTLCRDILEIMASIHPVRVRFAIGVGPLSTRLNSKQALGMDGPAFHRARAAMLKLKDSGRFVHVNADNEEKWALANHTLALVSHHLESWSQMRLRILVGLLRERSVRELETTLKISKVAIYKNINAAALDEVVAICQELSRAIDAELRAA
jgi:hypothetical protein